jgi:23S rRNA (uracil1939-C5)-methyltransferase
LSRKQKLLTDLAIDDAANDGQGVGRYDGRVVFVKGAVPGDVVDVKAKPKKKTMMEGKIVALKQASPDRVTPRCEHFGVCGGCKWQQLAYEQQLAYKEKQVLDQLQRIGGLDSLPAEPILPAPAQLHYRNKVEYTFSNKRWLTTEEIATGANFDQRTLGYHVAGFFDKLIDIERCYLHQDRLNAVRNRIRELGRAWAIPFYDIKQHTGVLRNLVFRTSDATGEVMLNLILGEDRPELVEQLFGQLAEEFPFITSWIWMHNPKKNDSYTDLPYTVWAGPSYITEYLGGYAFQISPVSFFQTNSAQAERLYYVAYELLGGPVDTLYDLYCGTGSLGIYCSDKARRVVGIEVVPEAVSDAARNAQLNQLSHLTFHTGATQALLRPELAEAFGAPQAVLMDPPRAGVPEQALQRLKALAPERIVYVSCKPSTQARDIALLTPDYSVQKVQPVDMFPQTAHVENVVLLQRAQAS